MTAARRLVERLLDAQDSCPISWHGYDNPSGRTMRERRQNLLATVTFPNGQSSWADGDVLDLWHHELIEIDVSEGYFRARVSVTPKGARALAGAS